MRGGDLLAEAVASEVILAAGGLLWRRTRRTLELAVIHRPKYDDWTLPKGKLGPQESWMDAAVREVREETGCNVEVLGFAGCVSYLVKATPKVVLFWNMRPLDEPAFRPNPEVDKLVWMTVDQASANLSHGGERRLVREQEEEIQQ